jgi:hypothetical protein
VRDDAPREVDVVVRGACDGPRDAGGKDDTCMGVRGEARHERIEQRG